MIHLLLQYLVIVIIFTSPANAQFHFVPAIIQLSNGDTIDGWIDDAGLESTPNRIRFQQNPDERSGTFYYAYQISGFKMKDGVSYYSYTGDIDSAHIMVKKKKSTPKPQQFTDNMFMRVLVEGRVRLLYGTDKNHTAHYFLWPPKGTMEELHYFQIISYSEGTTRGMYEDMQAHRTEKKLYKQQLLVAFADNKAIYEKLADANVRYSKHDFIKWITAYNQSYREPAGTFSKPGNDAMGDQ
ncbi:MAG: hypothetical protein ABIO46_05750 [Chitinophagales bacterium]